MAQRMASAHRCSLVPRRWRFHAHRHSLSQTATIEDLALRNVSSALVLATSQNGRSRSVDQERMSRARATRTKAAFRTMTTRSRDQAKIPLSSLASRSVRWAPPDHRRDSSGSNQRGNDRNDNADHGAVARRDHRQADKHLDDPLPDAGLEPEHGTRRGTDHGARGHAPPHTQPIEPRRRQRHRPNGTDAPGDVGTRSRDTAWA